MNGCALRMSLSCPYCLMLSISCQEIYCRHFLLAFLHLYRCDIQDTVCGLLGPTGCPNNRFAVIFERTNPTSNVASLILNHVRLIQSQRTHNQSATQFSNQFFPTVLVRAEMVKVNNSRTIQPLCMSSAVGSFVERCSVKVIRTDKATDVRKLHAVSTRAVASAVTSKRNRDGFTLPVATERFHSLAVIIAVSPYSLAR